MPRRAIYRAIWIPSLLALLAMEGVYALQPYHLPPSGDLVTYTTSDGSISLLRPSNWKPYDTSRSGESASVRFAPVRTVRFSVATNLAGSLLADIAKGPGGAGASALNGLPGVPGAPQAGASKPPLEGASDRQAQSLESDGQHYPEYQDGESRHIQLAGVDAIETDFTYKTDGPFGPLDRVEMVGKRVAALLSDREMDVVCSCAKRDDGIMRPVFEAMIASLHAGQGR